MKKAAILMLSHGLALGVGWLAFTGAETPDAGSEKAPRVTKTPRTEDREEGRKVLAEMRQGWGTEAAVAMQNSRRATLGTTRETIRQDARQQQEKELETIRQRSLTVVLTDDPAAELTKLTAGPEISHTAAFAIAWLRADPAAALKFLESSEILIRNSNMTRALEIWVAEAGADEVAGLLAQAPGWQVKLAGVLVKVAAAEDPAQLDGLIEQLEGNASREQLIRAAFQNLPEDKRPAALEWILGSLKGSEAGRSVMMMALGMDDNVAAKAFLTQAVPKLDPEALKQLKGWGNYGDIMRSGVGPDSPMEERVQARLDGGVVGKTDEEKLNNARASIVSQDVSSWMVSEHLGEVMKSGGMGAAELWQEAQKNFPQYDAGEREGLLRAVFNNSALIDPEGAVKLLEMQGHADQTGTYVLRVAQDMIQSDIEKVAKLVSQLPEETLLQNLAGFDRLYGYTVIQEPAKNGIFWTEWLRQQPAGVSKDLMLHYTARHYFQKGDEALGNELKDMVRDPTVKSWPKL